MSELDNSNGTTNTVAPTTDAPAPGSVDSPASSPGPADTAASGQPKDGEGEAPKPTRDRSAEKRISSLTRKNEELLTRLGRLEGMMQAQPGAQPSAQDQPSAKPRSDQYKSWEEYNEALIDWKTDQKVNAGRQQETAGKEGEITSRVLARLAEDGADVEDFDDVMDIITHPSFPLSKSMRDYLDKADHPAKIAQWLADNEDKARRISRLRPESAVRELDKQTAQVAPKAGPSATTAPPPVPTVGGRAVTQADPGKMDNMAEYKAYWDQRNAKRG